MSSTPPNAKKRRTTPTPPDTSHFAQVSEGTIWHQDTVLHFGDAAAHNLCCTTLLATTPHAEFALHLRQSCTIRSIRVNDTPVSYTHIDPLTRILVVEPTSTSATSGSTDDASRGTMGMTNGLRAASVAAHRGGNVRITLPTTATTNTSNNTTSTKHTPTTVDEWKETIRALSSTDCPLLHDMVLPESVLREKRIQRMAQELHTTPDNVYTIRIEYTIINCNTAGLTHLPTLPALYTTCGVHGDHQGPQCWLPVMDGSRHRWTHSISITATCRSISAGQQQQLYAPAIAGCGQDAGVQDCILHTDTVPALGATLDRLLLLGGDKGKEETGDKDAMDVDTDDDDAKTPTFFCTALWKSHIWLPVSCRSLGFAIGPFQTVTDDTDGDGTDDRAVRQVVCIPRVFRSTHRARRVVPVRTTTAHTAWQPQCLGGTTGVAGTAWRFVRELLQISFRTTTYTQIWLPLVDDTDSQSNTFLGGAILNSRLLDGPDRSLPYYAGGRALQFQQARAVVDGWVTAALPLGSGDDVGDGYVWSVVQAILWSLYERGHGVFGEGTTNSTSESWLYCARYAAGSGLNSPTLDFLPVQNIEDQDGGMDGVGAVPVEDRNNDQLWRGANNGSESHTSGIDEFNIRQLLARDTVEALERGFDFRDKKSSVPRPSSGWSGSYFSLSFLSSNAASSTDLGCGAVELMHPVGGQTYRTLKSEVFRQVLEGRAGVPNLIRLVRAAFIAAYLQDTGETELKIPRRRKKGTELSNNADGSIIKSGDKPNEPEEKVFSTHPFVVCVNEIVKKKGLTHNLFTRALLNLGGRLKEAELTATFGVDADPIAEDPRTRRPFMIPEGFPNSYVRGASMLYLRVGVHVESVKDAANPSQSSKGIQLQAFAEPVIPEGGIAYCGPITMRVVENEGSFREYVKDLAENGSRRDWGASFLHAKPVTTVKAQTAASGAIETSTSVSSLASKSEKPTVPTLFTAVTGTAFDDEEFHTGGYQAIELIRLTNLTPLLWVRVDPVHMYGGKISVSQPDACLAEQLFHDGDAAAQVDAIRALAERPLSIQGTGKVTVVHGVAVAELPVRVLGDCLRGTPALHSSLPHTPGVRAHAALAIAQWQNNKAPASKDTVGPDNWVGLNLLIQYFRERFTSCSTVMPNRFTRISVKKSETSGPKGSSSEGGAGGSQLVDEYSYLDLIGELDHKVALEGAEAVELEECEEYRVRSACITAVACIKAKDGQTPPLAIELLEAILESSDNETSGNLVYSDKEKVIRDAFKRAGATMNDDVTRNLGVSRPSLSFNQSLLLADALLALCYVRAKPALITDPETGKQVEASGTHPLSRLIKSARNWLDWELLAENIRIENEKELSNGAGGNFSDVTTACAIIGLSNLAVTIKSTTNYEKMAECVGDAATGAFYLDILDRRPLRSDSTRAAAAQAFLSICCAADRFEVNGVEPAGLLTGLEQVLARIFGRSFVGTLLQCISPALLLDPETSRTLRHILADLMMDACTGKVCSYQRVGAFAGRHDLVSSAARFYCGPLGAPYGGDSGACVTIPAAAAVTDGARRGMRMIGKAGRPKETSIRPEVVIRVAKFGTQLWRTVNGDDANEPSNLGVCAFDGVLRSSLLALWQWIFPRGCIAVLQVQSWKPESVPFDISGVMKKSESERTPAAVNDKQALEELARVVGSERKRQEWRGEMAKKAYEVYAATPNKDPNVISSGVGHPLPQIERDAAFRFGGWIASAAHQRRAKSLDGGAVVSQIRLKMKTSDN